MLTLPEKIVFALVLAGSIAYYTHRIATLVRMLRLGTADPEDRFENLAGRAVNAALDVILQRKVLRKPVTGLLHLLIVWGFLVFTVNTINHFTGAFVDGFHLFGDTALARYQMVMGDLFAVLILIGVVGLGIRRFILKPDCLTRASVESAIMLSFIGGAMLAFLMANATEIALGRVEYPAYRFVSVLLANAMSPIAEGPMRILAHVAWWADSLLPLALLALVLIPTKHLHLLSAPFNILFARSTPRGRMTKMDLEDEEAESFGISTIEQYSWKQLLDLYSCIECGRCQDFCPAYHSEKPLNPKLLISGLKHHFVDVGPALLAQKKTDGNGNGSAEPDSATPSLISDVVTEDVIWACTTCGACIEHCPMAIEHVDKLTDLRRYLVLTESKFPEEANVTFRNMETAGNPWGLAPAERAAWAEGLDVPLFAEKKEADVLFWVGCSGSYDDRSKKVSVAMTKILQAAGVDFAILGEQERCHCESARRLGNEYLYQMAAMEIAETLGQYTFKRILVTCPHCLNTFANEFPEFEASYEVIHHAEFIDELIRAGKLKLRAAASGNGATVFHDSCYLGRYNGVFDAPRQALETVGERLVPAPREREKGLCCGAGGGRMWLEEALGKPISTVRTRELLETNAEQIATSCPFCITMLTDGVKDEERPDIEVKDIAEIVAESIEETAVKGD